MAATYFVDFSTEMVQDLHRLGVPQYRSPAGSWPSTNITWRLLRQESVRVEGDMIIERWMVLDAEADPSFQDKLVEPSFAQDVLDYEGQVTKSYVKGRSVVRS